MLLREEAVHALPRPGLHKACMLGALQEEREHGIVTYDGRPLHRLPLLPDGLPVQRAEVRVGRGARRRSSSASSASTGSPRARPAGLRRGLPSHGGRSTARATSCSPRPSGASTSSPERYNPTIYGEHGGGRHPVAVPGPRRGLRQPRPARLGDEPGRRRLPCRPAHHLPGLRRAGGALRGARVAVLPRNRSSEPAKAHEEQGRRRRTEGVMNGHPVHRRRRSMFTPPSSSSAPSPPSRASSSSSGRFGPRAVHRA